MDRNDRIEKVIAKYEDDSSDGPRSKESWRTDFAWNKDDIKIASLKIAEHLIDLFHVKTISEGKREVLVFSNGRYIRGGEDVLRKWIQESLKEKCNKHLKDEILEKIKDLTTIDRKCFVVDEHLINLNNGIFNLATRELIPHDPKYLFLYKISIDYVKDADCPAIKKFLRTVQDRSGIAVIQEWAGFTLYRKYFIKKSLICVGEKDTGKTTTLRLLTKFIGEENVSGVSLQRLTDTFAAAHLYHKHLNSFDDLSFRDVKDNGTFKMATGTGYIPAEYKFGNHFEFENYAKLTFACNKIPNVKDADDDAYFGRWIVLRFENQIKRVDPFLVEKITTKEELSGFFNFALAGLKRLLDKQRFTYDKTPQEIKNDMMLSGSAITTFIATCLVNDPESWVSKDELYEAFKRYCLKNGLTALTKKDFGGKIKKYASYIKDGKKLVVGKKGQVPGWRNIKITALEFINPPDWNEIMPENPDTPAPEKENITNSTMF
jgi:P4 family phage/plasmid primase-like protien